jgi:hypothetical protein
VSTVYCSRWFLVNINTWRPHHQNTAVIMEMAQVSDRWPHSICKILINCNKPYLNGTYAGFIQVHESPLKECNSIKKLVLENTVCPFHFHAFKLQFCSGSCNSWGCICFLSLHLETSLHTTFVGIPAEGKCICRHFSQTLFFRHLIFIHGFDSWWSRWPCGKQTPSTN